MLQQVLSWISEYAIKKKMKKLLKGLYIAGGNEFLYFPGKEYAAYSGFLTVYMEYNKDFDGPSTDSMKHLQDVLGSMVTNATTFSDMSNEVFTAWLALLSLLNFNKIHNVVAHNISKAVNPLKLESDPLRFLLKNKLDQKCIDMCALKQKEKLIIQCTESIIQASKINLLSLKSHFNANLKRAISNLLTKLIQNVGPTAFEKIVEDHQSTDLDFRNPFLSVILDTIKNEVTEDSLIKLVDSLLLVDPSDEFAVPFKVKWEAWQKRQDPKPQNPCECDLNVDVPRVVALNNYIMTNLVEVQMLEDILISDKQERHFVDNDSQDVTSTFIDITEDTDIICLSDMDENCVELDKTPETIIFPPDFAKSSLEMVVTNVANDIDLEQDPLSPSLLEQSDSIPNDSQDIAKLFSQLQCKTVFPIPPVTEIVQKEWSTIKAVKKKKRTNKSRSWRSKLHARNSGASRSLQALKRPNEYNCRECSVKLIRLDPIEQGVKVNEPGVESESLSAVKMSIEAIVGNEASTVCGENKPTTQVQTSIQMSDSIENDACVSETPPSTEDDMFIIRGIFSSDSSRTVENLDDTEDNLCMDLGKTGTEADTDMTESTDRTGSSAHMFESTESSECDTCMPESAVSVEVDTSMRESANNTEDNHYVVGSEAYAEENTTDDTILADPDASCIGMVPDVNVPLKNCHVILKKLPSLEL